MAWIYAAASAALAGVSASNGSAGVSGAAKANNDVLEAQSKDTNRVRVAGNAFAAAKGAVSRYLQSVNNNRTLEAGGTALEANIVNARRTEDAFTRGSFEDQIKRAEQLGQQSAAAAFAGVGGEVADTISVSTRLMQQRAAREALLSRDFRLYDTARRAASIQSQMIQSLDTSLILDSLDYTINTAKQTPVGNPTAAGFAAAAGSLMSNASLFVSAGSTPTPAPVNIPSGI